MNTLSTSVNKSELESIDEGSVSPPNFEIVAAITASLERDVELQGKPFKYVMGTVWNLKNPAAVDFIEQVEKKFRKKNKFHSYFSGLPSNQTPINLQKYIDDELVFGDFAKAEMRLLTSFANEAERASLSGGNLVFIHYKTFGDEEDHGRLMIVMVDKKGAFEFDEKNLEPKRLQPIDTDALRQAAMFDLTLFSAIYPKKSGAAYLHFIEGRSKSEFFKSALGCDSAVSNKESVANLFEAIKQFSISNALKNSVQEKITEKVYEHIEKNIGKQVALVDIQHIIDKQLPDGHAAVGQFSEYANENGHQVNSIFEATRHALNKGVSIQIKDYQNNYSVSVKAKSIGYSGADKPVIVDEELTYIMIPLSPEDRENIRLAIGTNED
ncbi:nucleoid-associated protein [Pseudomonas lactis]|uniref:nucleoid-associated protein n=1 Tax=Pseudomonas lactis TaxID=1615674 RepID=UPI00129640F7|nr:nucleoid-associated protein [Pseudomonas lactis]